MAWTAGSPRPRPRSLMTPNTWTAPVEETRIRTVTLPSIRSCLASAMYSGLGLKRTLGPLFAVAIVGPAGFGIGGGVFWPRLTTLLVEFSGPVPPVTPCGMPATATGPLAFMFCPVGEPEPRLTTVDWAPAPLLDAGMPDIPLLPRLMAVADGLLETAMGLVVEPSATAVGCGELLGT